MRESTYTAIFAFSGIGGGALGFKRAHTQLQRLGLSARFTILGGIECDESTARDFTRLTGAPCLVAKVEELTPERLREFFGEDIDIIFFSPPCKAACGLLPNAIRATEKYQDMGMLGSVFVELMFAAWPNGPRLLLMENVSAIVTKFPKMMEHIRSTCRAHGFHIHEEIHDLGELGALAQRRKRLLFVGRRKDVTALLYKPVKRKVKSVGQVLSQLPLPGCPSAGRLHQLPAIEPMTALRLALIPAGGDWRDLPPEVHLHESFVEVLAKGKRWKPPSDRQPFNDTWRVVRWEDPAGAVTGGGTPSAGGMSVADPRIVRKGGGRADDHGVVGWAAHSSTITTRPSPSCGRFTVADPRTKTKSHPHTYGVIPWEGHTHSITGNAAPGGGPFSVADARVTCKTRENSGIYGVIPWTDHAWTVTAHACHDNGRHSCADPRHLLAAPFPIIFAADGTLHRPFTLLERALLQGFDYIVDDGPFDIEGTINEVGVKIGDAVPPPSAEAIAVQMLHTLLYADAGSFALSSGGAVWVGERTVEALQ